MLLSSIITEPLTFVRHPSMSLRMPSRSTKNVVRSAVMLSNRLKNNTANDLRRGEFEGEYLDAQQ